MANFDLTLPLALPPLGYAAQKELMIQAQRRLELLGAQLIAYQIEALFESLPALESMSFAVEYDVDSCVCVEYSSNRGASSFLFKYIQPNAIVPLDPDITPQRATGAKAGKDKGLELFDRFIRDESETLPWVDLDNLEIKRRASDSIAALILQKTLSASDFALWQSSQLEASSALESNPARSALSL